MADETSNSPSAQIPRLIVALLTSQWVGVLAELWKLVRKIASGLSEEGLYEVLEYEATLELLDKEGEKAQFRKREKVRYLQSQTIAYQDQAWADGEILLDYRCAPGVPVDKYRPGQKTYILISLREVKRRGDIDEFNIEWGMQNSFLRRSEQWETEVSHRTKNVKVQLMFPEKRPPIRVSMMDGISQRAQPLTEDAQVQLPDGRWLVSWEMDRPRLYGRYVLKWDW
jgi:hypothetical protein